VAGIFTLRFAWAKRRNRRYWKKHNDSNALLRLGKKGMYLASGSLLDERIDPSDVQWSLA
jgi:hypothetical protein